MIYQFFFPKWKLVKARNAVRIVPRPLSQYGAFQDPMTKFHPKMMRERCSKATRAKTTPATI